MNVKIAQLNEQDLQRIVKLESELNVSLVAYDTNKNKEETK